MGWKNMFKRNTEEEHIATNEYPFLPEDGGRLNMAIQQAGWTGDRANFLMKIAENLPQIKNFHGRNDEMRIDEYSIPSPWARFILFDASLTNKELNNLHVKTLTDWRGFLALLALKDLRGIKLSHKTINFDENISKGSLFSILAKTKPTRSIFECDKKWDKLHIIQLDGLHTIGVLSPATIICTPYEYDDKAKAILEMQVPWFKNGVYEDPIEYLDPDQLSALYHWLEELAAQLKQESRESGDEKRHVEQILGYVEAFNDDIRNKNNDIIKKHEFRFDSGEYYQQGVLGVFLKSITLDIDEAASDLAVFNKPEYVIVAKKMWNIPANSPEAQRIKVFGNVPLSDYPNYLEKGSATFGRHEIPVGIKLCKGEDLLLDELHLVRLKADTSTGVFNDQDDTAGRYSSSVEYKGAKYSVLWPLNKDVFDIMEPLDIKQSIRAAVLDNGDVEISLSMKLTGPKHLKRSDLPYVVFDLTRTYSDRSENGTGELKDPLAALNGKLKVHDALQSFPIVAMWPHRKYTIKEQAAGEVCNRNIWKKYFTFICCEENSNYDIKPVCGATELLENYEFDRLAQRDYVKCRTYHSDTLPEYAYVTYKDDLQHGFAKEIGVTLFRQPKEVPINREQKWKIGLDFGTTSTTAFCRDHRRDDFIRFGKTYKITEDRKVEYPDDNIEDSIYYATQTLSNTMGYKYFMPSAYLEKKMYLSIYESLREIPEGEKGAELKAFCDGHVFFHNDKSKYNASAVNIYKNLKWGSDAEIRAARKYLMQIMLQCVNQAASNGSADIEWLFSYPTALSKARISIYKENVKAALQKIQEYTGVNTNYDDVVFVSESVAASLFFRNIQSSEKPLPNERFVCIDIGGGSTDVSIWQGSDQENSKLQTSFGLASRMIFLNSLFKSGSGSAFRLLFTNDESAETVNRLKENGGSQVFESQMEYELYDNELALAEKRKNISPDNKQYEKFINVVSFGFLGLLYYVMMLLEHQVTRDNAESCSSIKIYLSGNGAKMYDWVQRKIDFSQLEVLLAKRLENIGVKKVKIFYKPETLKNEAAAGLLHVEEDHSFSKVNDSLIAGESFSYISGGEKKEYVWDFDMANPDFSIRDEFTDGSAQIKPTGSLTNLESYIDFFNEVLMEKPRKKCIEFNDELKDIIQGKVEEKLIALKKEGRLDPLFILGVSSVMEVMIDESSKGNQ